jgi:hypothetical protein
MVLLSPIIRLDTKESFSVIEAVPLDLVVVRLQDLISKSNFKFTELFNQIVACGGLHKFLSFDGKILLSLIMRDEIIANFGPVRYAEAINSLCPDLFTTVDGETYEGEVWLSAKELKRINSENQQLLALVSGSKPVGLVKGCTPSQIENHAKLLVAEGMGELIFHVGDFFRLRDLMMIKRARMYSLIIRKYAKSLILYGLGSPKRIL